MSLCNAKDKTTEKGILNYHRGSNSRKQLPHIHVAVCLGKQMESLAFLVLITLEEGAMWFRGGGAACWC